MFVDELTIKVIAGKGGDGCTSFRREKCEPMGGPNGGNGGKGASIIFQVDKGLKTLIDLRYMKIIKGKKGENGSGQNRNGASAEDIIIKVPEGTTVVDESTNLVIADLVGDITEVVVAEGGRGGRGNVAFKTQTDTAPKFSELGEPGEEKILKEEENKVKNAIVIVNYKENMNAEFLSEVKVSHITSIPCSLEGTIIGRGNPGCIFNEDFVIKDNTGIIFLDYNQPIHLVNKIFALFKSPEYFDKKVKVKGWYRRSPVPYVELKTIEIDGKVKKVYTYKLTIFLYIMLLLIGLFLIGISI